MKPTFLSIAAALLLTSFNVVRADALAELAAALPTCGLKCTVAAISTSGCGTNQTCSCASKSVAEDVQVCLTKSCTVREALTSAKVLDIACQRPLRDKSSVFIYAPVPMAILATISVLLRISTRFFNGANKLWWDDACIVAGWIIGLGPVINGWVLAGYGMGKDLWHVPFDHITKSLTAFYIGENMYIGCLTFTKISILLFYLRIFKASPSRKLIKIVLGINIFWGVIAQIITTLQCWPISYYWTRWDGTAHGRCNNSNAQAWVTGVMNILLDLLVMALPFPELVKLHMDFHKKMGILIMFSVGLFVTIVSAVRLSYLQHYLTSENFTYDNVKGTYLSLLEAETGVLCACLPALRTLFGGYYMRVVQYTNFSKISLLFSTNKTTTAASGKSGNTSKFSGRGSKGRLSTLNFKSEDQGTFVELHDYEPKVGMTCVEKAENDRASTAGSEHRIV